MERGAGAAAQYTDHAYESAGATLVERTAVWSDSDILLKVRAPNFSNGRSGENGSSNEVKALREGGTLISFLYPAQNKNLVDALASRRVTSFAMDMIPRISRAQVFDALRCGSPISDFLNPFCSNSSNNNENNSSMANIAGYKAVLEASNQFGRFLPGQVTAAG